MRRRLVNLLVRFTRHVVERTAPNKPDPQAEAKGLRQVVHHLWQRITGADDGRMDWLPENIERAAELVEARAMIGTPWLVAEARDNFHHVTGAGVHKALREADPISSQGATGDINLMLQTVNWKREINLSWLEFSRWGIQQIILISRLYWMKNPIVRRLVNVCAAYVFARGVEVLTGDEDCNAVLKEFFDDNKATFGRVALMKTERAKDTDGNIFWCFFGDIQSGRQKVRRINALEIMDIITNPDDADEPWFYLRVWTERALDATQGTTTNSQQAWYPSIHYRPDEKDPGRLTTIRDIGVKWESPIYHRKCGDLEGWLFGCPRIYPMLDWARESKDYLTACMAIRKALSQFAMIVKTKGGQQALDAIKQQIMTTVGPTSNLLDANPPAVAGATFGSGPGTTVEAFKTQGSGFDPEGVRQYKLMCCVVKDVPETFLGDVSTGNLATATTLDRPTETSMMALQEEWVHDLIVCAQYVLSQSETAAGGKLREALAARGWKEAGKVRFMACERNLKPNGRWKWGTLERLAEAKTGGPSDQRGEIKIQVNFPSIREGDMKTIVDAAVEAGTLGNKGGQIVGVDEKALVKFLYRTLDIEDGDELAELQYPEGEYDPDRTTEKLPPPIPKLKDQPGVQPQPDQVATSQDDDDRKQQKEALRGAARKVLAALNHINAQEGGANGHSNRGAVV